jgi:2TM family of unknown function (DUF5676)
MKIQTRTLALAVGLGTGIAWTICSLLVAVIPGPAMSMTGSMMHLATGTMAWQLTWGGFFAGLIGWSLTGGLFAWLCGGLYNSLSPSGARG